MLRTMLDSHLYMQLYVVVNLTNFILIKEKDDLIDFVGLLFSR